MLEKQSSFEQFKDRVIDYFTNPETWLTFGAVLFKIIIILVLARIVVKVSHRAVNHMMQERERNPLKFSARRSQTIGRLINNVISYIVNFIALMLVLSQLGFELMPLLAGAGVLGLAIGFGAQNLVKDVITGFFIIFEDQFGVGDTVQVGNFKGTVEEIGLRVTKIKNWTGEVHIIPNGSITEVTNFSIHNSIAVVDVSVAYEADMDLAMQTIRETAAKVCAAEDSAVKEPEVLGVQSLGASEVIIRVTVECLPNTHFAVGRKLNAELKKALEDKGVEIPYPKMVMISRRENETA
ncbi:mechanosensitive ion channel family protein [Marinicrinis lubricantis]|uniref:Mechanosensitive ion channel family protein n=1 Tax=Marinicrinis lubricantis TaxID=2086470 RepID=A0ABW1IJ23_9BACL